jgi:hypothetical protein
MSNRGQEKECEHFSEKRDWSLEMNSHKSVVENMKARMTESLLHAHPWSYWETLIQEGISI